MRQNEMISIAEKLIFCSKLVYLLYCIVIDFILTTSSNRSRFHFIIGISSLEGVRSSASITVTKSHSVRWTTASTGENQNSTSTVPSLRDDRSAYSKDASSNIQRRMPDVKLISNLHVIDSETLPKRNSFISELNLMLFQ